MRKITIFKRPKNISTLGEITIPLPKDTERNPENLLDALKDLQKRDGGLTKNTLIGLAQEFNVSLHQINSLATFYSMLETDQPEKTIRICDGPVCWLAGAEGIIREYQNSHLGDWLIERNSCLGLCDHAPAALAGDRQIGNLDTGGQEKYFDCLEQIQSLQDEPLSGETRVIFSDIEKINPDDIESAINHGVFKGLVSALELDPEDVISTVKASNLVGRGGAGFPTGVKWSYVASLKDNEKFIVCNADESEPLAVKDRVLIDRNPFLIVAGMAIAGYAVGAEKGIIYIRGEYPLQASRMLKAIQQAEEKNLLGQNILGTDVTFHIHVHSGAGAYICGEETALLESLEGRRGEPRLRPPYPTTNGYMGKPTVVNNVETFANVPIILRNGPDWYNAISESKFAGTKIYAIFGQVAKPRVFEAPFGITLSEMINNFGGGMQQGVEFGFSLVGGAAGRFVPPSLLDMPLDYSSGDTGAHIGVGAALVCGTEVSPVMLLRELMAFFERESCGKCTPCRVGTRKSRQILDEIIAGTATVESIDQLLYLSSLMGTASFCGLGVSVPWPVNSAIKHFKEDFESYFSEDLRII